MNERIQELWVQSTFTVVPRTGDTSCVSADHIKKFTEMIVREVFSVIENERYEIYDPVVHKVKQHFGVEQ